MPLNIKFLSRPSQAESDQIYNELFKGHTGLHAQSFHDRFFDDDDDDVAAIIFCGVVLGLPGNVNSGKRELVITFKDDSRLKFKGKDGSIEVLGGSDEQTLH